MTLLAANISPIGATIATDTIAWDPHAGAGVRMSKLHVVTASQIVIVGRGFGGTTAILADRAKTAAFDALAKEAPAIVAAAWQRAPRGTEPRWLRDGCEALIVGPFGGMLRAVFVTADAEGTSAQDVCGTMLRPWPLDEERPRDLHLDKGIITAMRRQVAFTRGLYPDALVGGELVLARYVRHQGGFKVTVETAATNL